MEITRDMLLKANDYIPLLRRQELIEQIAQDCIVRVRMGYIPTGETEEQPMPERYQENRINTSLYLMGVLAKEYLKQGFEGDGESLKMPANLYDEWSGSHVLNQIESFRSDKDIRDKAYNLLSDFRDFRGSLYREIETNLAHHNDIVWRLMDAFGSMLRDQTAAALGDAAQKGQQAEMTEEEKAAFRKQTAEKIGATIDELEKMRDQLKEATNRNADHADQ